MAVKLRELYNSFKNNNNLKLVAGEKGIDNVVRWVHMVEGVKISLFLEKQELAFTTGIALGDESLLELVQYIFTHHASGMIINTGPFIPEIPREVLDFCDENDFPLLEAPWEVYMAEVMRDFCYKITISDRVNVELSSAIKNAIFFENQQELYIPQLERYNYNADGSYIVAAIQVVNKDEKSIVEEKERSKMLKLFENMVTYTYKKSFVFELEGKYILVFSEPDDDEVRDICTRICDVFVNQVIPNTKIYFALGEKIEGIKKIAKSYRQAIDAVKLQEKKGRSNELILYNELGLYKLLLSLDDSEVVNDFYNETLTPLFDYDKENNSDYVEVLKAYLNNNGSVKEVAAKLFYHRNTINYKLNKISEILNCDLSNLSTRLVFSIALMLDEIK